MSVLWASGIKVGERIAVRGMRAGNILKLVQKMEPYEELVNVVRLNVIVTFYDPSFASVVAKYNGSDIALYPLMSMYPFTPSGQFMIREAFLSTPPMLVEEYDKSEVYRIPVESSDYCLIEWSPGEWKLGGFVGGTLIGETAMFTTVGMKFFIDVVPEDGIYAFSPSKNKSQSESMTVPIMEGEYIWVSTIGSPQWQRSSEPVQVGTFTYSFSLDPGQMLSLNMSENYYQELKRNMDGGY